MVVCCVVLLFPYTLCVCVRVCVLQAATSVDMKKVVSLQNELEAAQHDLKAAKEASAGC